MGNQCCQPNRILNTGRQIETYPDDEIDETAQIQDINQPLRIKRTYRIQEYSHHQQSNDQKKSISLSSFQSDRNQNRSIYIDRSTQADQPSYEISVLKIQKFYRSKKLKEKDIQIKKMDVETHMPNDVTILTDQGLLEFQKNKTVLAVLEKLDPIDDDIQQKSLDSGNIMINQFQLLSNQTAYLGTWLHKKRNGYGKQYWQSGAFYEGQFKDDKCHGYGRLIFADGDYYNNIRKEGEWADDKKEGKGKYYQSEGGGYDGQWLNDLQHGYGVEICNDGNKYQGEFYEGKKQGQGQFCLANGCTYEGEFFANTLQGFGKYVWKSKMSYEGQWELDLMHGNGIFKWPDGRVYVGNYSFGEKEGYGELFWPNGTFYKGYWSAGKQHGAGILMLEEQKVVKGNWKLGVWENNRKSHDFMDHFN